MKKNDVIDTCSERYSVLKLNELKAASRISHNQRPQYTYERTTTSPFILALQTFP